MPNDGREDPWSAIRRRLTRSDAVTPDGIAVIGVAGTLVKKASWMDAWSGLQSYQMTRAEFQDAIAGPASKEFCSTSTRLGGLIGRLKDVPMCIPRIHNEAPTSGRVPQQRGHAQADDAGSMGTI